LQAFAAKAWRRPLDAEMAEYVEELLAEELHITGNEIEALRNAVLVILSDPEFLYLSRIGNTAKVRNYELIAQLAYFLWDGPPDAELTKLANRNRDLSDSTLIAQVDRLVADPRSKRFLASFVSQWIGFSAVDQIAIDPNYYRNWRPSTKPHMKAESVAFFSELLKHDLTCLNVLDSDFIMANQRMGQHYRIKGGVSGNNFSRVPAPEGRGGVLTQAGVLLAYSNGQDAHAVNRGVWLRSRLLGDPPSEPPPDVPALADQDAAKIDQLTIKQRLEKHRIGACYNCHKDIDPWGIAMEGFDAIGNPRTQILRIMTERSGNKKLPVVQDVAIDGHSINGMGALKKYLREHRRDDFANGFTRHMLSYAIGRPLTYRDEEHVVAIKRTFQENEYNMKALIKAIVTSSLFNEERVEHPGLLERLRGIFGKKRELGRHEYDEKKE
jgi:hypothetical protein